MKSILVSKDTHKAIGTIKLTEEQSSMEEVIKTLMTKSKKYDEVIKALKEGESTALGVGMGGFESMRDWNVVMNWIKKIRGEE